MACTLLYNKHRQKTKPVRTTTKNRVWPLQKIGKFCNYQIKTSKMPTAFCQATKSSVPFDSYPSWVILFRKRNQSTLLVTQQILPLSFSGRVSKLKRESLLQALMKMYMLASCKLFHTNFCARDQFLFGIKRLSKFLYRCFEI